MQYRSFIRRLAPAAAIAALLAATVAQSGLALASSSESFLDTSEVALNPQPLPPRDDVVLALNPQPLPPRDEQPVL
jgi:hypothetical protein